MILKKNGVNVLKGILPTFDTFDVNPSNPNNCTDQNQASVTGYGSKVTSGAANVGNIKFDLGSEGTWLNVARIGLKTSAGTIGVYIEASDDNNNFRQMTNQLTNTTSTTEVIRDVGPVGVVQSRYFRIRTYVNSAATAEIRFYEVEAIQILPA